MISNKYFCWKKELSHEVCQKLINLGQGNWNRAAAVNKSDYVRKSDIVWIKEQWVYDLISPYMFSANEQAGWKYNITAAQDCQVTRYTKDGFYNWHIDGMGSHSEVQDDGNTRKLSMSVILNSDYEGGDFEMRDLESKIPRLEKGSIIVFPSFLEHRVTPVTEGIRYSLVTWFVGPPYV
jgi:PKHD-type hydroxylase